MKKLFLLFSIIAITATISRGAPSFSNINENEDKICDGVNVELIQGVAFTEITSVTSAQQVDEVSVLPNEAETGNMAGEMKVEEGVATNRLPNLTTSDKIKVAGLRTEGIVSPPLISSFSFENVNSAYSSSTRTDIAGIDTNQSVIEKGLLLPEETACGTFSTETLPGEVTYNLGQKMQNAKTMVLMQTENIAKVAENTGLNLSLSVTV